jgi:hypothetical protein
MDYELAKQLKGAGFPQFGNSSFAFIKTENGWMMSGNCEFWQHVEHVYTPTLEELIEACGKPIWIEGSTIPEFLWMAGRGKGMNTPLGKGSTPTEAVAHLWLALHANGDASA